MHTHKEFFFAQQRKITEDYDDILEGGNEREKAANYICDSCKAGTVDYEFLLDQIEYNYGLGKSFVRMCLKELVRVGVLIESGKKLKEKYSWAGKEEIEVERIIKTTFGEADETPSEWKEHIEQYGFDSLVTDVSKWIDHEGRTIREYITDRLWLMKYIDFLELTREYISWQKADQSIARKKYQKAKSSMKGQTN